MDDRPGLRARGRNVRASMERHAANGRPRTAYPVRVREDQCHRDEPRPLSSRGTNGGETPREPRDFAYGMSGLPRRSPQAKPGKLMVKQGGFGFAESMMVPSSRAPLRIEVVERSPPQRDGHLGTVSVLDKTRRTEGQDKEAPMRVLFCVAKEALPTERLRSGKMVRGRKPGGLSSAITLVQKGRTKKHP